jgi:hypothetical protein
MAKTIGQLTELAATPDSTDIVPIEDGGVTKKISVSNLTAATLGIAGNKTVAEGTNLALGTTTGTKIGTATTQKLGFYNATPVVQPANTVAIDTLLVDTGLRAAGGSANFATQIVAGAGISVSDAQDIAISTGTGTKIGTDATQKIGFWNATPAVQPAAVANLTVTASTGTLPTPDGSVTVNATTPTVAQLLEYCVELEAKLEDLLGKLRTIGIIAT